MAWGVGLSHERSDIAGAEGFHSLEGNMCGTLCEVLSPCRGLRPHHVQRDRTGSWEVSCLAAAAPPNAASNSRRPMVTVISRARRVEGRYHAASALSLTARFRQSLAEVRSTRESAEQVQ